MIITEFKGNGEEYNRNNLTRHAREDRAERITKIDREIGIGSRLDLFEVDKHHRDGLEVHEISDNGVIIVYNKTSKKVATMFVARPGRILRYYKALNRPVPEGLLDKAKVHQELGFNNI